MASLSVQLPGKDENEISTERSSEPNATPRSNSPPVADNGITESPKFPSIESLPSPCSHHRLSITADKPDLPLPFLTAETDNQDPHSSTGPWSPSLDKQTLSEKPLTSASASASSYASGDPTPLASETHQPQQLHQGESAQVQGPGCAAVQAHALGEKASTTSHENAFEIEDSSLPVRTVASIEPEAIIAESNDPGSYPDTDAAQDFLGEAKQDTGIETEGVLQGFKHPELRDFQHFELEEADEKQMRSESEDITALDSSITETGMTIPPIPGTTIDPISLTDTFSTDSANKSVMALPPQVPPHHTLLHLQPSPQSVQPERTDSTLASPPQRKEYITVEEKPVSSHTKPETPVTCAPQTLQATNLARETPDKDSSSVESTAEESELAEQVVDKGPVYIDLLCNHPGGMALPTVIARSITREGSGPTTKTAHATTSRVSIAPGGKHQQEPTSTAHVLVDPGPTTGDLAFLLLSQLETDISSSISIPAESNTN